MKAFSYHENEGKKYLSHRIRNDFSYDFYCSIKLLTNGKNVVAAEGTNLLGTTDKDLGIVGIKVRFL